MSSQILLKKLQKTPFCLTTFSTLCSTTLLATVSLPLAVNVLASQDIIINATKLDKSLKNLTGTATVITEEDIAQKNYTDLTEVFRREVGLEFKQAGGPGGFNYPKMRGLRTKHILVLIDGVRMNSTLTENGVGNLLGQIDPATIERIEILRGPQAALYGADSTAGVISITTKGGMNGLKASVGTEAGSLNWSRSTASIRGGNLDAKNQGFDYSLNLSVIDSGGVQEHESYHNVTPQLKLAYNMDNIKTGFSFIDIDRRFQYAELIESYDDDSAATPWYAFQLPDPHQGRDYNDKAYSVFVDHTISDTWSHKFQVNYWDYKETNSDLMDGVLGAIIAPFDGFNPFYATLPFAKGDVVQVMDDSYTDQTAVYTDQSLNLDYNLTAKLDNITTLFGIEHTDTEGEKYGKYGVINSNITEDEVLSFYLNTEAKRLNEKLILAAGLRSDDSDLWGDHTTGNIGVAYTFNASAPTLFANVGTSFKSPAISAIIPGKYSNPNLQPEKGKSYELGLRQSLLQGQLSYELAYFKTKIDDVISYDYNALKIYDPQTLALLTSTEAAALTSRGIYVNSDRQVAEGLELTASYDFTAQTVLHGNYSYTDSDVIAGSTRQREVQIARNKANLAIDYTKDNYTLSANLYYAGPRSRWKGDIESPEYVRLDVTAQLNVTAAFTVYGRIENLTDEEIIEDLGFEQPGVYSVAGVNYKF